MTDKGPVAERRKFGPGLTAAVQLIAARANAQMEQLWKAEAKWLGLPEGTLADPEAGEWVLPAPPLGED